MVFSTGILCSAIGLPPLDFVQIRKFDTQTKVQFSVSEQNRIICSGNAFLRLVPQRYFGLLMCRCYFHRP